MSASPTSDTGSSDRNDPKASNSSAVYRDESKMEKKFPWQVKFNELCRSAVGSKSMKMLENLLTVYLQKGSGTVKDCYTKPIRATKLKKCMSDALVFFHLFYQDIKESFENSTYLEKMTELMAMYLDIEITASKRRKEHVKKVICRLTSALNIFLDHSENHILDVIIRAQFITKNYREICSPMLGKLLTSLRVYPMNDTLYVRYLLVFKLWKMVVADADERKNINKIAIQNLPAPSGFTDRYKRFNNVLPRVPASMGVTMFYMQAKFNLKTACQAFMKISKDPQQPIISDNPLFFEGRLASSQSTFSGKANAFECGVSRNLMNDIWSIAEPASKEKKSSSGANGKYQTTRKKTKEKSNKTGKKKTKDWLSDKEKKKKKSKSVSLTFGNFKEINSTEILPPKDNLERTILTTEPTPVAARPSTTEILPTIDVSKTQESVDKSTPCSFLPDDVLPETKPLLNLLTPNIQPEPPITCKMEDSIASVDTKPSITSINLNKVAEGDNMPPFAAEIPRILLSPPDEETPKAKEKNGLHCQKNQVPPKEDVVNNMPLLPLKEESNAKRTSDLTNTSSEDHIETVSMQNVELIEENNSTEGVESVKASTEKVVPAVGRNKYLDHEQENLMLDVVNEVTIGTTELVTAEGDSDGLPYLECQKEEVIETHVVASPVPCIDFTLSKSTCPKDSQVALSVEQVQSVIVPPIPSKGYIRPNDCFVPPSQSLGAERIGVEQHPVEREVVKCVVPCPPKVVGPTSVSGPQFVPAERPVFIDPRQEVKPEIVLPPEEMTFPKEVPQAAIDDEMLQQSGEWFGLFAGSTNTDLLFECIDMPSGYGLDSTRDTRVINPRMLDVGGGHTRTIATPYLPPGDFHQHYGRVYADANMHRSRVENMLSHREFLADDYPIFNATSDSYSYYNTRDLYGNFNPNFFFDDPRNQLPPRDGLSRKQAPSTSIRCETSSLRVVDHNSSSSHNLSNSTQSVCDKDNSTRHPRGTRVPVNSDDNYYRETDSLKTREEQVLGKVEEPVGNTKPSNMKASNLVSVGEKHLLQKLVTPSTSSRKKTPHTMVTPQDNRRNVGYSAQVQLSHMRPEEATPKPAVCGGMFLESTGMPVHPINYVSLAIPIPIPIPIPLPPQPHVNTCTCDECFKNAEAYILSSKSNASAPRVPSYHPSGLDVRVNELKHRDDELLKNIEDSMKAAPTPENSAQLEGVDTVRQQAVMDSHSSLPPKKRHKLSSDLLTQPGSTCPESFPSFGVRPMMNILELGEDGNSPEMYMYKSRHQSVAPNNPRSVQEGTSSYVKNSYQNTKPNVSITGTERNQLQQSNNVNNLVPTNTSSTSRYPQEIIDDSEMNNRRRDEFIASYWEKKGISKKKPSPAIETPPIPEKEASVVVNPRDDRLYKPSQTNRTYPAPTKTRNGFVNYAEPMQSSGSSYKGVTSQSANLDSGRRQFRTPAQLKELPSHRDTFQQCFPYCPHMGGFNMCWSQRETESMIIRRESYVPQPPPSYRMSDSKEPPVKRETIEVSHATPSTSQKKDRKKPTSSRKKPSESATKRVRCSKRTNQSGTGDGPESKRKRKDSSR